MIKDRDLSKLIEIEEKEVPIQTVSINGIEQVVMGKSLALICPTCKHTIQSYQQGSTQATIRRSIETEDEELLNRVIFCSHCGQKVQPFIPKVIEGVICE